MNRRQFMRCGGMAAAVAAVPLGAVLTRRPALLDDPQAWLGAVFSTEEGLRLRLVEVSGVRVDRHTVQAGLRFDLLEGRHETDGSHTLRCSGQEATLFLQPGMNGPVACVNRLRQRLV